MPCCVEIADWGSVPFGFPCFTKWKAHVFSLFCSKKSQSFRSQTPIMAHMCSPLVQVTRVNQVPASFNHARVKSLARKAQRTPFVRNMMSTPGYQKRGISIKKNRCSNYANQKNIFGVRPGSLASRALPGIAFGYIVLTTFTRGIYCLTGLPCASSYHNSR